VLLSTPAIQFRQKRVKVVVACILTLGSLLDLARYLDALKGNMCEQNWE
jgi:hypothetical protein